MWNRVQNMDSVLENVPKRDVREDECSIPDVYGKAIQFHLALKQDYNGQKSTDEVNMWRGMITLLALQKYYDLPLSWEKVTMPNEDNLFCNSLKFIPANFSIFRESERAWDGRTFYVLTWKKSNGTTIDLFLYSPATLVYPVADWLSAFSQIEIEWFDRENGFQSPEDVLGESDKKIVAFWLNNAIESIRASGDRNNPSTQMILHHLRQYCEDLKVNLNKKDLRSFSKVVIGEDSSFTTVLETLNYTIEVMLRFGEDQVHANRLFSDLVCYFKDSKDDIFRMCSYKNNYKVAEKNDLYAFLPLNSVIRKYCGNFKLASGVSMTYIKKGKTKYIRAKVCLPDNVGLDLVKDYKMVEDAKPKRGEAFSYFDNSLSKKTPLIAIWPNKVSDIWNRYYIMLDDELKEGNLEIADNSELNRTTNKYIVQTTYVPDAIPLVIKYSNGERSNSTLSIGMLSLHKEYVAHDETTTVHADVAVDFGTSSTRVFAKIEGRKDKTEIFIIDDRPLIIMTYGAEQNIMRHYFVASQEFLSSQEDDRNYASKIFSIYKRDNPSLKRAVSPVLDGVIYQAKADEKLGDQDGSYVSRLMTDLKWDEKNSRPYYKAFLQQLCLHVTNILYRDFQVNDITWRYALPEIMSASSKGSIQSVWTTDIGQYLKSMTNKITCTIAESYETESNAASKYFLYDGGKNANAEKGYLVMDIGGGSTDLALWQGTLNRCDMKWHDSVNVAGHRIFTRWVAKWLKEFRVLTNQETLKNMIDEVEKNAGTSEFNQAQNALVDRILTIYAPVLLTAYEQECDGSSADYWAMELRSQIIHGISILFFAVGYQVGLLAKDRVLRVSGQPGTFVIAVGGRGAKILDWTKNACDKGPIPQVFFDLGRKAAIDVTFPKVIVQSSEDPKSEVARGLLELEDRHPNVRIENDELDNAGASKIRYSNLFLRFVEEYKNTFGELYPLPTLTKDSAEDMLRRYRGDKKSLINVFMQVLYECWATDGHAGGQSQ